MKSKLHINFMKPNRNMLTQSLAEFFVRNVILFLFVESLVKVRHLPLLVNKTVTLFHLPIVASDVVHAEVLWVIKVITSHYSFNSSKDVRQYIFQDVSL